MDFTYIADSYKHSHWQQYPKNTTKVYSYFESRMPIECEIQFFGLQRILCNLENHFYTSVDNNVHYATHDRLKHHFDTESIYNPNFKDLFKNFCLPLKIMALPEGTIANGNVPLFTVENTDERFPWLTNYVETLLSQVWYPCTVATLGHEIKKILVLYLKNTGCDILDANTMLHDFGFRGVSSFESASTGGLAHLLNFNGTDTLPALNAYHNFLVHSYFLQYETTIGKSIPATEHSTMTMWGRDNEYECLEHLLNIYENLPLSVVVDSYDVFNYVKNLICDKFKDKILKRKHPLIIRPDSGRPHEVLVNILNILEKSFDIKRTNTFHKKLPDQLKIIWGDGIDKDDIKTILSTLCDGYGWAANNFVFGMGGGLLQKVNRDTYKFAYKCSAAKIDGQWKDVYKSPVTDRHKVSKPGRFHVIKEGNRFYSSNKYGKIEQDMLIEVYNNGFKKIWDFNECKNNANHIV